MAQGRYDVSQLNGAPPPGFDFNLLPEAEAESSSPKPFQKIADDVLSHYKAVFMFMDKHRQRYETRWRLAREYYNQAEAGKYDSARLSSIFEKRPDNASNERDLEYDPARWSVMMPIVFEAVQQLQARLFNSMFGPGPDFIEIQGREKNDTPQLRGMLHQVRHLVRVEEGE